MFLVILLLAGSVLSAFLFDMFVKPERSLYFYLLVRFLFPKHIEVDLGGEPVLLWRAAETVAFLLVMLVVFMKRRSVASRLSAIPSIGRFFLAFAATLVISTLLPLLLAASGLRPRPVEVSLLRQEFLATHYVFAVGVFLAAILFLDSVEKIETFFKWTVVCGGVALLDFVLLYVLDIAPTIREATTGASGGFGGMAFGGPDQLGRSAIFAIFAAFALHKIRRASRYLWMGIWFFVLVVVAASRPVAISLLSALLFYKVIEYRQKAPTIVPLTRALVLSTCLLVPLGIVAFQRNVVNWVESLTGRTDYFQPELGGVTRLATWVRVADVSIDTFPFGSGGGLLPFYMAGIKGSHVASHFGLSGELQEYYQQLIEWRFSSVHNLYLEFIGENGLGGMILVIWFGLLVFRAFRRFLVLRKGIDPKQRALLVSLFATLFAAALNVNTDATFKIYWFYLILLYAVVFLSTQTAGALPQKR